MYIPPSALYISTTLNSLQFLGKRNKLQLDIKNATWTISTELLAEGFNCPSVSCSEFV